MTKLHQVLPHRQTRRAHIDAALDQVAQTFRPEAASAVVGLSRTYLPLEDDGLQQPPQGHLVAVRVPDLLTKLMDQLASWVDYNYTLDEANCRAFAPLVVDGKTFADAVPTTTLLFLEAQLQRLATLIRDSPTNDAGHDWTWDQESGQYRSEGVQTLGTKKMPSAMITAPATERHPAQVHVYDSDVPQGTWTTVHLSGALRPARKRELLERCQKALLAVKTAREEANAVEIKQQQVGASLLAYVLGDLVP